MTYLSASDDSWQHVPSLSLPLLALPSLLKEVFLRPIPQTAPHPWPRARGTWWRNSWSRRRSGFHRCRHCPGLWTQWATPLWLLRCRNLCSQQELCPLEERIQGSQGQHHSTLCSPTHLFQRFISICYVPNVKNSVATFQLESGQLTIRQRNV